MPILNLTSFADNQDGEGAIIHASDLKSGEIVYKFREPTFEEIKRGDMNIMAIAATNLVGRIKVTSVKVWKTRPMDCDFHWKYGLYEYGVIQYRNGVRIGDKFPKLVYKL
jgi:hypothetical protein